LSEGLIIDSEKCRDYAIRCLEMAHEAANEQDVGSLIRQRRGAAPGILVHESQGLAGAIRQRRGAAPGILVHESQGLAGARGSVLAPEMKDVPAGQIIRANGHTRLNRQQPNEFRYCSRRCALLAFQ
jgi:hypothetical protein